MEAQILPAFIGWVSTVYQQQFDSFILVVNIEVLSLLLRNLHIN